MLQLESVANGERVTSERFTPEGYYNPPGFLLKDINDLGGNTWSDHYAKMSALGGNTWNDHYAKIRNTPLVQENRLVSHSLIGKKDVHSMVNATARNGILSLFLFIHLYNRRSLGLKITIYIFL